MFFTITHYHNSCPVVRLDLLARSRLLWFAVKVGARESGHLSEKTESARESGWKPGDSAR